MNNPRILVRLGTNNRIINGIIDHTNPSDPEYTGRTSVVQKVTKRMMGPAGECMVETESGDVWHASHADHKDYEFVAITP